MLASNVLVRDRLVLEIGEGSIDPQTRVKNGEISEAEIDEFVKALDDDQFYESIDEYAFPDVCVDGRGRLDGQQKLGANAAGASFSLVMSDALTTDTYRLAGETAPLHAKRLYMTVKKANPNVKIGTHDADQTDGQNCGCGAEDKLDATDPKLPSILGYITRRGADIQGFLARLEINVNDDLNQKIVHKAQALRDESYATNGQELNAAAIEVGGQASNETLSGKHYELALNVDTRPGRTLNRQKLALRFGNHFQAFNLNTVNLKHATAAISLTPEEAAEKFVAALYYNLATAAVLAGKSLRIAVH